MKKLFSFAFLTLFFISCSSDEDKDDFSKLYLTENEKLIVKSPEGEFFLKDGHYIFVHNSKRGLYAGSMECPNKKMIHKHSHTLNYMEYSPIDATGIPHQYIRCSDCKTMYVLDTDEYDEVEYGIPTTYNVSYDVAKKAYKVWK